MSSAAFVLGCGGATRNDGVAGEGGLSGTIQIDGSSTVSPIAQSVGEEFMVRNPGVRVAVSTSGTGGGFKKFLNQEIEICNASRPITVEELEKAKADGVDFIEIPIAYDGLSVVANKEADWIDHLTVDELKRIWEPNSQIKSWSQVRPGWPDVPIALFGADQASGTFDYFTEAICGKKGAIRGDYSPSADDNVLVNGVAGTRGSLGFFGFAYYETNADKLRLIPIDAGSGPVSPTSETIRDGSYQPLSRPLFVYIRADVAKRPEISAFIRFLLSEDSATLIETKAKYVPLTRELYDLSLARFEKGTLGSIFNGKDFVGVKLEDLISKEGG